MDMQRMATGKLEQVGLIPPTVYTIDNLLEDISFTEVTEYGNYYRLYLDGELVVSMLPCLSYKDKEPIALIKRNDELHLVTLVFPRRFKHRKDDTCRDRILEAFQARLDTESVQVLALGLRGCRFSKWGDDYAFGIDAHVLFKLVSKPSTGPSITVRGVRFWLETELEGKPDFLYSLAESLAPLALKLDAAATH